MTCIPKVLAIGSLLINCTLISAQTSEYDGRGRAPTQEELQAWNIDVDVEGKGLPPGQGTAVDGSKVYAQKCAACHGPKAEGGMAKLLAGGEGGPITSNTSVKSIGSFWPYATTLWDYINRGMPDTQPGSLKPDEVYATTAFLLYLNGIIEEDEVMDASSLPKIQMPNRNGFLPVVPAWEPGMKRLMGNYPASSQ